VKKSMSGPVILLTGAAGGLGSALSLQLAGAGAQLMLLDNNSRGLDQVSDQIVAKGLEQPAVCPLDLANAGPEAYLELADILRREFGGLDHLVHCAAQFNGLAPMDQIAPGQWVESIQVNLTAAWAMSIACLPLLRASALASITFLQDEESRSRSAYWGAYGVSKAGVASLAAILREELEPTRIRVLSFEPGPMRTALRAKAFLAEDPASQPDPRVRAEEIAALILEGFTGD
jgi:NAD(P)-dependent dehydrogenase (short-subunit alcohol dehydrogenase family)